MIQYSEVAGNDLVLQHGAGGDVDPVPVVGDDDDRAAETHCGIMINGVKILFVTWEVKTPEAVLSD